MTCAHAASYAQAAATFDPNPPTPADLTQGLDAPLILDDPRPSNTTQEGAGGYSGLGANDISAEFHVNNTCNAVDCDINSSCSEGDCFCVLTGARYEPGAGEVEYFASCSNSLLGKRGEPMPCPCNSTYVSHACCSHTNGLVWEGPEKKLGRVVSRDQ